MKRREISVVLPDTCVTGSSLLEGVQETFLCVTVARHLWKREEKKRKNNNEKGRHGAGKQDWQRDVFVV
jgi:hypothetical protein